MAILPTVGRKGWSARLVLLFIYGSLIVLGATMVVPFMITVSSSVSNDFDYERFWPVPRCVWSRKDRFVRDLVDDFNKYPEWYLQMRCRFPEVPDHWTSWRDIGRDIPSVDKLAAPYMDPSAADLSRWQVMATDYVAFMSTYPLDDTVCALSDVEVTKFLAQKYGRLWAERHPKEAAGASSGELRRHALQLLGETWKIPLKDFYTVSFESSEMRLPMWQQSWYRPYYPKYEDFLQLKEAYLNQGFTPGIQGKWLDYLKANNYAYKSTGDVFPVWRDSPAKLRELWLEFKAKVAPAAPTVPFAMRVVWRKYLESEEVHTLAGLALDKTFNVEVYNRLAGTRYKSMFETPFPLPADAPPALRKIWTRFVETRYPVRLLSVRVTPAVTKQFGAFLRDRFKTLEYANRMLKTNHTTWDQFELTSQAPAGEANESVRSVWIDFVKTLPVTSKNLTSSEHAWQQFLLARHGSVAKVNAAHGTSLGRIEEAFPPFRETYALTFRENELSLTFSPFVSNYRVIADYLLRRGNAIFVTLVLVSLAILCTLTINPLAAYALSRFNLRRKDKIILFTLATMAFPAMVSAIPAYLLIRDLGLLNTFFALVLPGAANGMAIFILKGFFDSLPQELYDAATIDGAPEWQIFLLITLPMMKPILAINSLTAFIAAYNGWQWALIICQKEKMWTIAVWLYQATQWWADRPWIVTAGFVVASVPTLLVFLFCQKIILRGIILPSMK